MRALVLLALGASLASGAEDPPELWGRKVVSLAFRGDAPVPEGVLTRLTDMAPGATFGEAAVRASFRNLFATGRFADLALEAAPSGDGVALVVVYAASPRIASVSMRVPRVPDLGRLRDALSIAPGDRWSPGRPAAIDRTVLRHLRERGFFDGKVVVDVSAGPDDTSVALRIDVGAGRRYVAAPPDFGGVAVPLEPAAVVKASKLRSGKPWLEDTAREDGARLETRLREAGFGRAEVRYEGPVLDVRAGRAAPRYQVYVGPRVVVMVSGAKPKEVLRHPDSPWQTGEPADEDALRRLANGLKRGYQEQGFARARVDLKTETTAAEEQVEFTIEKGERQAIHKVDLLGRSSLPESDLREILRTRPRGFLSGGRFVDKDAEQDRESIAAAYRAAGYVEAHVARPLVSAGDPPYTLDVAFPIEEGLRAIVGSRSIVGASAIAPTELLGLLSVRDGEPYSQAAVDRDLNRLRSHYAESGFAEARVDVSVTIALGPPPESNRATVIFTVTEGERTTFGKTVVRGLRKTKHAAVRRAVAWKEGEPFSLSKLLQTRQNLARLGIFDRIDTAPFPADPALGARSVILDLAESRPWTLLYGVGGEYDQGASPRLNPRVSFSATYANLFGQAVAASLDARWSRRDRRVVGTLRTQPLFDAQIPFAITAFQARVENRNPEYTIDRSGAFLEASKNFGVAKTILRYQYELVEPNAKVDGILSSLERQNQRIKISSVGPALALDGRDDPIDPRKGYLVFLEGKWAFPVFNADAHFLKGFLQAATYAPWGKTVLTASVRVGAIEPLDACNAELNPGCLPNREIPIAERFFAGGRSSHRAFSLDALGIEGRSLRDGAGVGGGGLLVFNAEWRLPIAGELGMTVFSDIGQVWAGWRDIGVTDLRYGAGLGLRYRTPFGPVRLEYGLKLDRKSNESAGELSFSIGYPF